MDHLWITYGSPMDHLWITERSPWRYEIFMQLQFEFKNFETPTCEGKTPIVRVSREAITCFAVASCAVYFKFLMRLFVGFALLRRTPSRF